ncbi:MAG: hypothetical protein KC502_01690 [Myxococcales bacterium]|nr:hypothetical protein [Myxococcales bacterium]
MTHIALPHGNRSILVRRCAMLAALALFGAACSGVDDQPVGQKLDSISQDTGGAMDAQVLMDTGPVDAAACPGALGCDCTGDDDCASGVCAEGVCANPCTKDCDDTNPCTVDLCVGATSTDAEDTCTHAPGAAGEPCSDGTLCTEDDKCASGACTGTALNCDDGSPCTSDWCHPAEGCKHDDSDGACDDDDVCTVGDACVAGGCAPGKPQNCEDGNPCTTDSCDKAKGCVHQAQEGAECDDGDACTSGDACKGAACVGGKTVACDDGKACTKDVCNPGSGKGDGGCVHTFDDGAACDDGSTCTIGDACKSGACISGKAQPCDDGNPCTADGCDAKKGCVSTPLKPGASCDDGNACSTGDTCAGGGCQAGKALTCDDGNACTKDSCDLTKGCVHVAADGGKCIPAGNSCTVGGICKATVCKPVAQVGCDDGKTCTTDACDKQSGKCVFTPLKDGSTCNDGAACTAGDACVKGECRGGKMTCNDNNTCTSDSCDGAKGCVYTPIPNAGCSDGSVCTVGDTCKNGKCAPGALQDCGDNNPCTDDLCDATKGCAPKNNAAPCDDNNACTTKDTCKGGACEGGTAKLCDDGNPCTIDLCDPGVGGSKPGCKFVIDDKSGCSDENVCTTGDVCQSGKCIPGKVQLCDDQNVCTQDACDPKKGCVGNPNTASCSDNDVCTVGDVCKAGKCVAGPYQNCDDQNACTVDACDPKTGCTHALTEAKCDDGNACTVGDTCIGGKCTPGAGQLCEDANACTNDGCDTVKGCVNVPNSAPCDDGNACSLGDVCSKGACVAGGKTKDCDDLDVCTQDMCYPGPGCKHFANTAPCDDGNACTTSDSCKYWKCVAGPKLDCNDQNLCTNDACNPKTGCTHAPNGNKPFSAMSDDASKNSGKWEFKASTGPVRFTHAGTGWYALSAPQNGTHTMTIQSKVDLSCAFNPTLYFEERYSGGSYWVEISDDGAKTWSPSLIRGGQSDYIWRRQALDLTGYKGKKILVRFRSKTTSTNNWWNIRNIAVRESDPDPKLVAWGTKVGCANFETEGPGWSCGVDGTSYQLNYKGANLIPNPNRHVSTARFHLRFDLSKVSKPYLTFEERHYYGILKVEVRSPDGDWGEAFLRGHTTDYAWRKRVVDLSDFKGNVVEMRFTVYNPHGNTYFHWGDIRRITFGTKPTQKSILPYGQALTSCGDWTLEDTVWECDSTKTDWFLQAKSDASPTKHANGYWHYAKYQRQLDLTKAKDPQLTFSHSHYYGTVAVQVSEDGGSWSSVWTVGNTHDTVWRKVSADLGQFLGKKVWIRIGYVPHSTNRWWRLRNIRVAEAPKPWPVVSFGTPKHDCGAWVAENATWSCDPLKTKYQFRYSVPVGLPGGYWVALTNERVYKIASQPNPHAQIDFRHYYGTVKIQASGDGIQWDDLYSVGNTHDLVWRHLMLPLGAYKNGGTVRLRIIVKPHSTSYWGEFKNFALTNPKPPVTVKPGVAFGCSSWETEGSAWACQSTASGPTLRFEGAAVVNNVNSNAYLHHTSTKHYVTLAGLKNPVLRAVARHSYGQLYAYVSEDGLKWHELAVTPNSLDLIWRKWEFDLGLWTGKKVFVRFSAKPNSPAYWGEIKDVSIGEYVAPGVAKVGDTVSINDLETEGGWVYDFVDKRFEGRHNFVSHTQSLTFKKVYDLSAANKPVLRFEHAWLYGYAYVDVSLDGKAWNMIWTRNFHGKRSSVMRPEWIDLSSVKGKKGVRIRFRHYAYYYNLATGAQWAVRNPRVVEYKAPNVLKAPLKLGSTYFEKRGLWLYNASTGEFSLNKPTFSSSAAWISTEHFLWPTAAINISGMSAPVLQFYQRNSSVTRKVEVSDDDGQTWKQAHTVARSSTAIWQKVTVDLSEWKASKALLVRMTGYLNGTTYWWQTRGMQILERPVLKSVGIGYKAKVTDWELESGWNANAGLNLIERKLDAIGHYTVAESKVTWDLSGTKTPKLVYESTYSNASRQIYVSVDGFAWQLVSSLGGTNQTMKSYTVDLSAFAGAKTLYVRLNSHISSIDRYWRVRNLKVVPK